MMGIAYQELKGWKYRLVTNAWFALPELDGQQGLECVIKDSLSEVILQLAAHEGQWALSIGRGYCWDGCSGPTIDRPSNMSAGLCHDGLYQLMREGRLPQEFRTIADKVFLRILREHKFYLAYAYYLGVSTFAAYAARMKRDSDHVTRKAP